MTSKFNFIFFIIFGWQLTFAQILPEAVSLEEALIYGEQNNRNVQKASMEIKKAYKDQWSTIAIGLPQISANANYQNFIELNHRLNCWISNIIQSQSYFIKYFWIINCSRCFISITICNFNDYTS